MSDQTIKIKVKDLKGLYETLTNYPQISKEQVENEMKKVFGEEVFKPADVRERIKTFEDAFKELGVDHPLVREWQLGAGLSEDLEAYLKLRIITAALNEGWEPKFTEDEWRYFPYFYLVTQKEIENMDEEKRSRVVLRSNFNANAFGGIVSAYADYGSSYAYTLSGSRLAFKTSELAIYAGTQFIDLWADYCFIPK